MRATRRDPVPAPGARPRLARLRLATGPAKAKLRELSARSPVPPSLVMEIAVWSLTLVLTFVGLAGVIVPLLPGTTLILAGMGLHKVFLPDSISWAAIAWIGAIWLISVIVDFVGVLVGTRLFGGGKWGMAGAGAGAVVGMFFSLPALILGTIFGAVVAERYVAKKTRRESLRAGAGAALGFVLSTIGRLACGVGMLILFLFAVRWPSW